MKTIGFILVVLAGLHSVIAQAQERWRAEATAFSGWGGPGTHTGDVQGYGLLLQYSHSERWSQTFGVDVLQYDLETPVHVTGVEPRSSDEPVDPFTTVVRLQSDVEYRWREPGRWNPYAGFGAGFYFIDVPDVSGNNNSGGTFELTTESPNTPGVTAKVGGDWNVTDRFSTGICFSYSQTFRKYTVTDTVSGQSGEIDPFAPLGLSLRFAYRL